MISCAANSGPLSVVIDLTGSPLSRMSLTTAFASGTACFPVSSFSMSIKQLFGGFAPQPQGKPPRCFSWVNAPQSFALLIGISGKKIKNKCNLLIL